MKTYIDRLNSEHHERNMIRAFQNELLDIEVFYNCENPFCGKLTLRKEINSGEVVRVYNVTNYSCEPNNHYANLDERSAKCFSDSKVENIYIAFMIRTFSDYKENYLKATNNQERKDLGKTI